MALNKNVAKSIKTRQENELLENNKLIATFDGREVHTDEISWFDENFKTFTYHKDWNELMRVVKKIGKLEDDNSDMQIDARYEYVTKLPITTSREVVYKAVVEFIEWYNEQDRFICGVCGERVNEYTYNEDKDIDECNNCKS